MCVSDVECLAHGCTGTANKKHVLQTCFVQHLNCASQLAVHFFEFLSSDIKQPRPFLHTGAQKQLCLVTYTVLKIQG